MKQCGRCRELKPESEYYRNSAMPDGLDTYCKEDRRKATLQHRRKYREDVNRLSRERYVRTKHRDKDHSH